MVKRHCGWSPLKPSINNDDLLLGLYIIHRWNNIILFTIDLSIFFAAEKSIMSNITESPLQSVDNKSPQLVSAGMILLLTYNFGFTFMLNIIIFCYLLLLFLSEKNREASSETNRNSYGVFSYLNLLMYSFFSYLVFLFNI